MNLVRREVLEILDENKTDFNGVIMHELKMLVSDFGRKNVINVILLEEDYNMIKEKGYYYC